MKHMPDATLPATLVLENFFSGPMRAEGSFVNAWSRSRRGIVIDIVPAWDGKVLSLDERLVYSDGEKDHKIWRLEKTGAGTYAGTREDGSVLGRATVKKWGVLIGRVELVIRRV